MPPCNSLHAPIVWTSSLGYTKRPIIPRLAKGPASAFLAQSKSNSLDTPGIVTGAGRGMGRAIADAYLHEGAAVVVTAAREQGELEWFSQQRWSERVLTQLADVTDPQACEQVVAQTLQRFGKVEVLVNNAGRGMKYVSSTFISEPTRF